MLHPYKCWHCNKPGHKRHECEELLKLQGNNTVATSNGAKAKGDGKYGKYGKRGKRIWTMEWWGHSE